MIKTISIVTEWSASIGSGHIQRMMNLASFINSKKDFKAYIINQKKFIEGFREFDDLMRNEIHPETSLIIRDMRDSSIEQIEKLKAAAPVYVIDDLGPGAEAADYKIDILPNPASGMHNINKFLYGYNFSQSLKSLSGQKICRKDIDIAFYTGYKADKDYVSDMIKLFPDDSIAAVLSGDESCIYQNGERKIFSMNYSEALLRSKVVISHFGLTLYEGAVCGATAMAVNPTEYHRQLTEIVKNELGIKDLGLINNIDKIRVSGIIKKTISTVKAREIPVQNVLNTIKSAADEFYRDLIEIMRR